MKKIISLLLAAMMLLSMMSLGFAETDNELPSVTIDETEEPAETAEPVFEITEAVFDGTYMSGTVKLVSGALPEGQNLFVRVVFFFAGNAYQIASTGVTSDGTFEVGISPNVVEYITVAAFSARRIRDDNKTLLATKMLSY